MLERCRCKNRRVEKSAGPGSISPNSTDPRSARSCVRAGEQGLDPTATGGPSRRRPLGIARDAKTPAAKTAAGVEARRSERRSVRRVQPEHDAHRAAVADRAEL